MSVLVKPPAVLKRRKLSSRQKLQPNTALGQLGENRAIAHLLSQNYLIVDRNIATRSGEIDVIALDKATNQLAFCEVKTRSQTTFGHSSAAFNWKKRRNIRGAALEYLESKPSTHPIRFDLITVTPTGIRHYKNVTC